MNSTQRPAAGGRAGGQVTSASEIESGLRERVWV